ncbi:cytochrome P450 [Pilatotrama ljubarskyi]|nr:cytochrome P450 [Pilatotrama ljubarskyi]
MLTLSPPLQLSLAAALLALLLYTLTRPSRPRPPGPAPKPLVGNVSDLPSGGHEWLGYIQLGRKYASDILYFTSLGTPLLVINSFQAAHDLLDRKGALYSDRPRFVMFNELMRWDWNLLVMPYNKRFIAQRRIVQQEFQPATVSRLYHPVIAREVCALLNRFLATPHVRPQDMIDNVRQMTGAIIMMVTYGHQVTSPQDEYIKIAEAVPEHAERRPGVEIVDVLPILKYLPSWFPGASFQKHAAVGRQLSMGMRLLPFKMVKERMAAGNAVPCMATRLLAQAHELATEGMDPDTFVMDVCGLVYSAGADTAIVAMRNCILAMMLFPDVQKRAQEELDRVIGRERLPTMADRPHLPYVSRLIKESLRWKAVSSLGVPHATLDSDEYRGYYIPKGTTVLANIYAMLHDESDYADPDDFNPDRFLPTPDKPSGEPDPARAAFGFGRRVCPGRFFADDTLFLTIASLLHVFAISVPDDSESKETIRNVRWNSGLVSHPTPFPARFEPRFEGAPDLVHAAAAHWHI